MSVYTFQGDDTVAVDTFIHKNYPTTNYGTNTTLQCGESNGGADYVARPLMRLDLTQILPGSIQNSGVLSLWTWASGHDYATNAATVSVYRVIQKWDEAQVTWNVCDSGVGHSWNTAGCSGVGTDRDSVALATASWVNNLAGSTEVQFTFAPHALEPYFGQLLDIIIQTDLELNDMYIFHSSSSATSANRPKLVIDYTLKKMQGNSMILGV